LRRIEETWVSTVWGTSYWTASQPQALSKRNGALRTRAELALTPFAGEGKRQETRYFSFSKSRRASAALSGYSAGSSGAVTASRRSRTARAWSFFPAAT